MTNLTIRFATLSDVDEILFVTNEAMLSTQIDPISLHKYGFLTIGLSADEIKRSILDISNTIAIVAEKENKIIGFTLGSNYKNISASWKSKINVSNDVQYILMNKHIFYHDYIARLRDVKGAGKQLLKQLIHVAEQKHYDYIMCEIAHEPIVNNVSIRFHEQFGFKCVGSIKKNNFIFGIYTHRTSRCEPSLRSEGDLEAIATSKKSSQV